MSAILNWYAVETYSGAEWQVHRELKKQGYHSWLPYYLDDVRRGRWKDGRVKPYFEGYVFLQADRKRLRDARQVRGVQAMVANADNAPAVIAPAVMDELIARLTPMPEIIAPLPLISFAAGEKKKLTMGPFVGFIAEIARVVSFDKIEVWMEAMGHKVTMSVTPAHLTAHERCA